MSSMEGLLKLSNNSLERTKLIRVINLKKLFVLRKSFLQTLKRRGATDVVRAVDGIDLEIHEGEIYGLAGESGCGKTTLGKMMCKLIENTSGKIIFQNTDITRLSRKNMKVFRKDIQMIFQDPFSSLPVRFTLEEILLEPFKFHKHSRPPSEDRLKLVKEVMIATDLTPLKNFIDKHPNELSGGQRQRVCIARALILQPSFLVADEPVSMLDVSVRAGILQLLKSLNKEFGITILLITHDLTVAQFLCDRIGIMYVGKLVEEGSAKTIFQIPYHPYTRLLKSVLPTLDPKTRHHLQEIPLIDKTIASSINPPLGCRFQPRCVYARKICIKEEPSLRIFGERKVACHALGDWLSPNGTKT